MAFVLFITGPSASGKSMLYESLKGDGRLRGVQFHDVDEHGVPPVGRGAWRAFRAEELLHEAGKALEHGTSTIVCGIIKPHEIVESRCFRPEMNVHFLMLNVPYEVLELRITERLQAQPKEAALDPKFDPDVAAKLLLATKDLRRELLITTAQQKNGYVLDAANLTKEQMHDKVMDIVGALGDF